MDTAPRSSVGELVLGALDSIGASARLPAYRALLDDVFAAVPPAYAQSRFGNVFRLRGRDASWTASLLASDSYMEGYSASRLWQYADCVPDQVFADSIRRHAQDEAKHSRMFGTSVFAAFPGLEDASLRASLASNTPRLVHEESLPHLLDTPGRDELINAMMLINLYEIKALVLCKLTGPVVIAHAPEHNRQKLQHLFTAIESDESQHIRYSAAFLERTLDEVGTTYARDALVSFQDALNRVTWAELDENPAEAGQAGDRDG